MIFRATQKMASKLRIACSAITDGYPTMVEWYCNVVVLRRRQFFLFTHAPSLFSLWTPAAGLHRDGFGAMFRRGAIDTLNDYGFSNGDAARIIDDGPDVFAKAVDRRVIGSMVDYAKMLRHAVEYEGGFEHLASRAMNDIANECPMSAIGMESPVDYLRQLLRAETPHNIAVHQTGARLARSGR